VSQFDPLLMHAVVARVEVERPDLDLELAIALCRHLSGLEGPQPTFEGLLEYMDHVLPWLGEDELRERLGLAPHDPRQRPSGTAGGSSAPRRRPRAGRPRGSGQLTSGAVRASHRAFRSEHGRRPTQAELAARLDVAVRSLQRFLRDHDMGWPLAD